MKPRKGNINQLQTHPINIPAEFKSPNVNILEVIEKLRTEVSIEAQQKLIKSLSDYLNHDEDSEFVALLLTFMFLTVDSKNPIRKTVLRILITASNSLIVRTLARNIVHIIENCKEEKDLKYLKQNEVITNLHCCFNNFPPGIEAISLVIDVVTKFVVECFVETTEFLSSENTNENSMRKLDIHTYIYNTTKLLVSILQQCLLSHNLPEYSTKLMLSSYKVINDEHISYDTKSNCGLIMVISVVHLPDHITNDYKFKENPSLTLLKSNSIGGNDEGQDAFGFENFTKTDTAKLCIYTGILNFVPQYILCEEMIDDVPVISFMFGKLLESAKRCSGKPTQILEVSKALVLISRMVKTIPLSDMKPMFSEALDYVWTHLDHFVDAVRHAAQNVFQNLIKLAFYQYNDGHPDLLRTILTNMIDLMMSRCTHYITLTIVSAETGCSFLLEQFSHLPYILLINMSDASLAPQICNTYEFLMAQHAKEEPDVDKWLDLWVDLVKPLLAKSSPPITAFYQRLLTSAYRIQPMVLKSLMEYQWYCGANELGALLGCLRAARKSNLVVPTDDLTESSGDEVRNIWKGLVEFSFLELMMCHQADDIRISVLALVIESQKTTEIFTIWELNYLKRYFLFNATTQSPSTRQQITSLFKKAFIRVREGLAVHLRNITTMCSKLKAETRPQNKEVMLKELQSYKKQEITFRVFMDSFVQDYLASGLSPGCNFQRKSMCLELLLFIATENCVAMEDFKRIWKKQDIRNLLQILFDPYESNVILASALVKRIPRCILDQFQSKKALKLDIPNALKLASAIKPSSATSASYILQVHLLSPNAKDAMMELLQGPVNIEDPTVVAITLLMQMIETGLRVAEENVLMAAKKAPCFGLLLCIRHLIEKEDLRDCNYWDYIITKLLTLCYKVSDLVSPIVNNESPEGYLPMDNGLVSGDDFDETVTSQMVLVYAWRTVKEVSLLLGELVIKAPSVDPKSGTELLSEDVLTKIGEHFLNLFLETKHRGAYEQAYLGFCKFCTRLWNHPVYNVWPKSWLVNILKVLNGENENTFHKLCAMRRSAGLPFMIQAIVTTEPHETDNENFHMCMKSLLNTAGDTSEQNVKSRTHAMHILRVLYRHNMLGELVAQYIAQGVTVAISEFGNDIWGVRNAATLLFSTLMVRMFGVHRTRDTEELSLKNRMSARVFFLRYPELHDFLLQQLIQDTESNQGSVTLHPVLLILERLYPSNTEEENQLRYYIPYVSKCLSNCSYEIRKLAAPICSASLVSNSERLKNITEILKTLSYVTISDNYCQGLLMQLGCLLKSLVRGCPPLNVPDIIEDTFWIFISTGKIISHYTASLYLDAVVLLTTVFLKSCRGALVFRKMVQILMWQSIKDSVGDEVLSTAKKKYRTCSFNLVVHLVSSLYHCDSYFKSLYLKELILTGLHSFHEEVNVFCLNFISYLYFEHPKYVKHSLYLTERLEVSQRELKLVSSLDPAVKEYIIESVHKDLFKKLHPVFYYLLNQSSDSCLSVFLVLQHYPCILNRLKPYKQDLLDFLLSWCRCDRDEVFSASLSAISTFLCSLSETDLKQLNFKLLVKVVVEGASPSAALHQRVSTAQFLFTQKRLFCVRDFSISVEDLTELWNAVITLLDDEDQLVRDTVSQLSTRDTKPAFIRSDGVLRVISECAREQMLEILIDTLPSKVSIPILLSWALKQQCSKDVKDVKEVFDKVELNTYAEAEMLSKLSLNALKRVLWKLDDGLNYEDCSIFLEEHTLMVATNVYNILYQNLSAAITTDVRITLLCVLKKILEFIERCPINKQDFQTELERLVVKEFTSIAVKKGDGNARCNKLQFVLKSVLDIDHRWT